MTSSDLRERSARPCSPSAQRRASARLLLPDPFGPTTALIPGPNSTLVRSANDLKPWSRSARRRGSAGRPESVTSRPGRRTSPTLEPTRDPAPPPHRPRRGPHHRRLRAHAIGSIASAAASVSAIRRDGPSTDAKPLAVHPHLDAERLFVIGPARVHEPVRRPVAGMPLGVLLEPALRALERDDRRLGDELGGGEAHDPVADRPKAEIEVQGAGDRLERRGQEQTAGAGRCGAPRLRRAAGTTRGRSARQAGRAPWSTRSPRAWRSGSPRPRPDGDRRGPPRWRG